MKLFINDTVTKGKRCLERRREHLNRPKKASGDMEIPDAKR
jgi:hypothetical protein